jgi:hypothetical protein
MRFPFFLNLEEQADIPSWFVPATEEEVLLVVDILYSVHKKTEKDWFRILEQKLNQSSKEIKVAYLKKRIEKCNLSKDENENRSFYGKRISSFILSEFLSSKEIKENFSVEEIIKFCLVKNDYLLSLNKKEAFEFCTTGKKFHFEFFTGLVPALNFDYFNDLNVFIKIVKLAFKQNEVSKLLSTWKRTKSSNRIFFKGTESSIDLIDLIEKELLKNNLPHKEKIAAKTFCYFYLESLRFLNKENLNTLFEKNNPYSFSLSDFSIVNTLCFSNLTDNYYCTQHLSYVKDPYLLLALSKRSSLENAKDFIEAAERMDKENLLGHFKLQDMKDIIYAGYRPDELLKF